MKFKCFESRGYFQTNLKWLAHKIWMLIKAILSWWFENLLGVLFAVQKIFGFQEIWSSLSPSKRLANLYCSK